MRAPILLLTCVLAQTLTAQTGTAVPELSSLDHDITALMKSAHVPGGAVAIVKDGRLIFARGYGAADVATGEAFQPDSLCRVGSVSKTVTAVALLRLVEQGRIHLDDRVFGDILTQLSPLPGAKADPRLNDITVRQLLHHTGGHGRDTGVDPLSIDTAKAAASALHIPMPPGYDVTVRAAMGLPLDFDPGTQFSYSNYGFMVLARVIERVTGMKYEDAVRQLLLEPLGVRRMAVGQTGMEDQKPGEVRYYDVPRNRLALSLVAPQRRLVPMPYANFELEAGDGSGRWIASAVDLARLVARVEGTRAPALLAKETLSLLFERPVPFVSQDPQGQWWYALGTTAYPNGNATGWTHGGFYPGATAGYQSFGNGYLFAFVFNATPDNDEFTGAVYNLLVAIGANQRNWPAHDLFSTYYSEN